jgi:uridine phosphorylase
LRQTRVTFPKAGEKHRFDPIIKPKDSLAGLYAGRIPRAPKRIALIYDRHFLDFLGGIKGFDKKELHPLSSAGFVSSDGKTGVVKLSPGAPLTGIVAEDFIAMGARDLLILGTAGGLKIQRAGEVVLCTRALRDDGTSHHYLPNSRYVSPSRELTEEVRRGMHREGLKFAEGATWTIDAPYTESMQELARYIEEGLSTVEMEAAALFAVARARRARAAAVFVVSDLLTERGWSGFVVGRRPEDFERLVAVLRVYAGLVPHKRY